MLRGLETQENLGMSKRKNTRFPLEPLGCLKSFPPSHPPPLRRHVAISPVPIVLPRPEEDVVQGAVIGLSKVRLYGPDVGAEGCW